MVASITMEGQPMAIYGLLRGIPMCGLRKACWMATQNSQQLHCGMILCHCATVTLGCFGIRTLHTQ